MCVDRLRQLTRALNTEINRLLFTFSLDDILMNKIIVTRPSAPSIFLLEEKWISKNFSGVFTLLRKMEFNYTA